jgi:hypothetical protein
MNRALKELWNLAVVVAMLGAGLLALTIALAGLGFVAQALGLQ